jgi:hypothetical protein
MTLCFLDGQLKVAFGHSLRFNDKIPSFIYFGVDGLQKSVAVERDYWNDSNHVVGFIERDARLQCCILLFVATY